MTADIQSKKLFNPAGNDDKSIRTIIKGNVTGLFNLNNTKYNRAKSMYTVMIGNFRIPEKVSGLGDDSLQYEKDLSDAERRAYDGILSFLIFLDSIQTVNLPNFSEYITAPEVNLLLAIQAYQEAIHSQSYATILETVVDSKKRDEIYYFWREDTLLLERNEYIGSLYQKFIDNPMDEHFFCGLVANYLLEGIYFYNGFAFFDTMADQLKMRASQRMINYIRRDELSHVTLFANILLEIKKEFPAMWDEKTIYEMFEVAVNQEIEWSHHIL
jgi:ribonucleoside-diphosphate reductase beta chain